MHPRRVAAAIASAAITGSPRGRGPGDIAAACSVARRTRMQRLAKRTRGGSGVGLRPCNDVTGRCWSGIRTRDSRIKNSELYPTELSSGGRTGFEPMTNGLRRCSASELSSARETPSPDPRHTQRQGRAHRTGVVNPYRCEPFEWCFALASRQRGQFVVRPHPPAARAEASRHSA